MAVINIYRLVHILDRRIFRLYRIRCLSPSFRRFYELIFIWTVSLSRSKCEGKKGPPASMPNTLTETISALIFVESLTHAHQIIFRRSFRKKWQFFVSLYRFLDFFSPNRNAQCHKAQRASDTFNILYFSGFRFLNPYGF